MARTPALGRQIRVACVLALAVVVAVHGGPGRLTEALAFLFPPLLLLLLIAPRRYPGERTLLALVARREQHRAPAGVTATVPRSPSRVARPRGARLMGWSLAIRPPPAPPISTPR
jgi:hypothetical protein